MFAETEVAFTILIPEGPETLFHEYDTIPPSGSLEALPSNCTEFNGSVMVTSLPAFAIGEIFGGSGAGFTVTTTVSASVPPLSSVTVKLNTYTPCIRLVAVVVDEAGFRMLNNAGPLNFVHV